MITTIIAEGIAQMVRKGFDQAFYEVFGRTLPEKKSPRNEVQELLKEVEELQKELAKEILATARS